MNGFKSILPKSLLDSNRSVSRRIANGVGIAAVTGGAVWLTVTIASFVAPFVVPIIGGTIATLGVVAAGIGVGVKAYASAKRTSDKAFEGSQRQDEKSKGMGLGKKILFSLSVVSAVAAVIFAPVMLVVIAPAVFLGNKAINSKKDRRTTAERLKGVGTKKLMLGMGLAVAVISFIFGAAPLIAAAIGLVWGG